MNFSVMRDYPVLNFPKCTFRVREDKGAIRVWDQLRRAWITLSPEEWVRQHMLRFFTHHMSIPPTMIRLEYPVNVQGMPQRADAVIIDSTGAPLLVAECKSPDINIAPSVYAQAVRYNYVLGAKFMMLTNGLKHYCYEFDGVDNYRPLENFPDLADYFTF